MLPKAMAALGIETHLVSSTAQINYYSPDYDKVYKPFLGPKFVATGIKQVDGYTLHRLPFYEPKNIYRGPGILGLYDYLEKLRPDIIQTFEIRLDTSYIAARYATRHPCLFFTECHIHASIFRKTTDKTFRERFRNLRSSVAPDLHFINKTSKRCYAIAEDVAQIAASYYRVPKKKISLQSLGVDTHTFHPPAADEQRAMRSTLRERLGWTASDIVCIYTGRFTKDKNPHCLALAIEILQQAGHSFKGLFVGNGPEEDLAFIRSKQGCQTLSFVPARELPAYYWTADIGVWPREESTSQLDAAGCGLPLVLSDRIKVKERVDGNGLLYKEGDPRDLAAQLLNLADPALRRSMGETGIRRVQDRFSWDKIAGDRLKDYESFASPASPSFNL
jgi:glycosyltransferase involved in cell wall biosynthesis